eukprot:UN12889
MASISYVDFGEKKLIQEQEAPPSDLEFKSSTIVIRESRDPEQFLSWLATENNNAITQLDAGTLGRPPTGENLLKAWNFHHVHQVYETKLRTLLEHRIYQAFLRRGKTLTCVGCIQVNLYSPKQMNAPRIARLGYFYVLPGFRNSGVEVSILNQICEISFHRDNVSRVEFASHSLKEDVSAFLTVGFQESEEKEVFEGHEFSIWKLG